MRPIVPENPFKIQYWNSPLFAQLCKVKAASVNKTRLLEYVFFFCAPSFDDPDVINKKNALDRKKDSI